MAIDGGGSAITTGMKGYAEVPYAGTLTQVDAIADRSGSIVVNLWKCSYAQFDAGATHPVIGDKITASTPPTISSGSKSTDSTLASWTTALSAGDVLAFNVDSVTTIQRVTLLLKYGAGSATGPSAVVRSGTLAGVIPVTVNTSTISRDANAAGVMINSR